MHCAVLEMGDTMFKTYLIQYSNNIFYFGERKNGVTEITEKAVQVRCVSADLNDISVEKQ